MDFTTTYDGKQAAIADLFAATFTASEGAEEGASIGALVRAMFATTNPADIRVFLASQSDQLAGAAIFTRMRYAQDDRSVFILSPMAVATEQQGTGIGQGLLSFALEALRQQGADIALTYGDIRFYSKVGFGLITEAEAAPPLALTYPDGWLGQSLTQHPFAPLRGASSCVAALNDPAYW